MKTVGIVIAVILGLLMLKEPRTVIPVEAAPAPTILTYQQLVDYPVTCDLKDQQLTELQEVQRIKNFNPNSDELNEADYHYNSRLKATIWYYSYGCEQ
jgi:hypothetical protein